MRTYQNKKCKRGLKTELPIEYLPSMCTHKALGSSLVLAPSHVGAGSQDTCVYCLCLQQCGTLGQHRSLNASCRSQCNQLLPNPRCPPEKYACSPLSSPPPRVICKVSLRNYDPHLADRTRDRAMDQAPVSLLQCHPKFQMAQKGREC